MNLFKSLLLIFISFLFSARFALAITNGITLADEDYPAVVLVEDMGMGSVGTGVVVGNGTIITAKHCAASADPKNIRINGEYIVSEINAPDNFGFKHSLDLALLKVPKNRFKSIIPIIKEKLPAPPFQVSIIGYGLAFKSGLPLDFDEETIKRIGYNVVGTRANAINDLTFLIEFEQVPYDPKARSGALPGDSGGPMMLGDSVIGIASKSIWVSSYMNLLGSRAQKFLNSAVANGWDIEFK